LYSRRDLSQWCCSSAALQFSRGFWVSDPIVLVCGVFASLAGGVLIAYGVCLGMFRIFRMRAAKAELQPAGQPVGAVQVVEG
jgi:uncharacterized protein (DUF2062 family)